MNVEEIISLASNAKDHMLLLISEYRSMPELLHRELEVIKSREFNKHEATLVEKNDAVERLEYQANELRTIATRLCHEAEISEDVATVSSLVLAVRKLTKSEKFSNLSVQVLQSLEQKLTSLQTELLHISEEVRPKIEFNRTLVHELLASYQQSQRFWQEVVAQIEATYLPDGKKRNDSSASSLKVKA